MNTSYQNRKKRAAEEHELEVKKACWLRDKDYKKLRILKKLEILDVDNKISIREKLERVENLAGVLKR